MEKDLQPEQNLSSAIAELDSVVFKSYLEQLSQHKILPLITKQEEGFRNIRLKQIARIVYDRNENNLKKFNNVFSALHSCDSSVALVIKAEKQQAEIFIGTYKSASNAMAGSDAIKTLDAAIQGNFPGIDIAKNLFNKDIHELLSPIQGSQFDAIANVVGVPSLKVEGEDSLFSQGLEKLIEGMQGREYYAVFQATPVLLPQLEQIENAYQDIYTALSVFEQKQVSLSENQSRALGISLTEGITQTLTKSVSQTQTHTEGRNQSKARSDTKTESSFDIKRALAGSAGSALAGGTVGGPPGAAAGAIIGFGTGLLGGSQADGLTDTVGTSTSESTAKGTTHSEAESTNKGRTDSDTHTSSLGRTLQVTEKNRQISSLLTLLDEQLERIKECKSYGMWTWAAYFIAPSEIEAKLGADLYSGIFRGDASGLERHAIGIWNRSDNEEQYKAMQNYIAQLQHPVLHSPTGFSTPFLSPTTLISTKEMAVAMGLPNKSLPGLPVFDAVAFGQSVTSLNPKDEKNITIGQIANFGSVSEHLSVELNLQSLTSHTFITGSTGAGKSNIIYSLLSLLKEREGIPFLVIEPAKGEYKKVLGGHKDVSVFGTNPKLTELLKINPFSFPKEIHIIEHIDRLIEVLNAVWPMYAAMPAILKEAIELTYVKLGWDLLNSECSSPQPEFPDFHDLLRVLPEVINQSDYSQEMKGNYMGALVTRVKSLTNGYFSTIFQKDELKPSRIFNECCIIDLSRVGSAETKSLLMGVLFLKLQEFRMAHADNSNSELRHITVLEEAHNLLPRTSTEQGSEGSNLKGKSVEMIANALAEMRTYGESFIIADQAPGLLDQSAIRNTNTKIILRLPDFDDCNLVGRAAHLNEDQITELARLKTGCAAVYQNNWLEPVLCQFPIFDEVLAIPYRYVPQQEKLVDQHKANTSKELKEIIRCFSENESEKYSDPDHYIARRLELQKKLMDRVNVHSLLDKLPQTNNLSIWLQHLAEQLGLLIQKELFNVAERNFLITMLLEIFAMETPNNESIFMEKIKELNSSKESLI
ncbi:MAG: ATP-binding protein [Oceanospirillaceae bacterium]|nr:ATP-binding protein [Oceanospirillaceae bacterium]